MGAEHSEEGVGREALAYLTGSQSHDEPLQHRQVAKWEVQASIVRDVIAKWEIKNGSSGKSARRG
jgi:hypothetical protein